MRGKRGLIFVCGVVSCDSVIVNSMLLSFEAIPAYYLLPFAENDLAYFLPRVGNFDVTLM